MTDPLGDRIRVRRALLQDMADAAQDAAQNWAQNYADAIHTAVQSWAKNYTDVAKAAIKTYVDNQITAVLGTSKTYVDSQILVTKAYVDQQNSALSAQITKVVTDNNLQP
jgi:hypothetical protein